MTNVGFQMSVQIAHYSHLIATPQQIIKLSPTTELRYCIIFNVNVYKIYGGRQLKSAVVV